MESPLYDTPYTPNTRSKTKKMSMRERNSISKRDNPEGVSMHLGSAPQPLKAPSSGKKKSSKKQANNSFSSDVYTPIQTEAPHTTPVTSTKKGKKRRVEMELEDSQIFINPEVSVFSAVSRDSGLSDSEIDVDASSLIAPSELNLSTTPAQFPKKKRRSGGDTSWERKVKEARGSPDGAGDSTLKAQEEEQEEEEEEKAVTPPAAEKMVIKNKTKDKVSPYEKKKKKPYAVLEKAASKIKKMSQCTQPQNGKRKSDTPAEEILSFKERKKERKMQSKGYETSCRAKQIWEQLRKADISVHTKHRLCAELHLIVKGQARQLIFAHDMSRVVQCLYKHGKPEIRMSIFEELRDDMLEVAKSKYAKFFLMKLMKYGSKSQRDFLFRKFYGNMRRLIRHKEASFIVEAAYNNYANATQRSAMVEEFYGPSYALFKTGEVRNLAQILKSNPERRDSILSNMRETLSVLADKALLRHTIVHRIFFEYMTYAPKQAKMDMIESVREGVVEMLHTRDGARVAMLCLWNGNTKDRKVIVKSFKTFVAKICMEEYGHLVMLALFDSVDDTKLVCKALLSELIAAIPQLVADQYGRKVLMYLLSPRDPRHFHPDIVQILKQGDGNPYSKKDESVRRGELLEFVSRPLVQYVSNNCEKLTKDNSGLLFLVSIITQVKGDPTDAMRAVAELAAQPFETNSSKHGRAHLVEHAVGNQTLKRLVLNDAAVANVGQAVLFSSILMDVVPEGGFKSWIECNRGCFILISLLELGNADVTQRIQKELTGMKTTLRRLHFKGSEVLLNKL